VRLGTELLKPIEQTIARRLLFSPSCSRRLWPGKADYSLPGLFLDNASA
jgi:hypothetical protein